MIRIKLSLILLFFLFSCAAIAQSNNSESCRELKETTQRNPCKSDACIIPRIEQAINARCYQYAFENLESAGAYRVPENIDTIVALRQKLFDQIMKDTEDIRAEAERKKIAAEKAKNEAERKAAIAKMAEAQALEALANTKIAEAKALQIAEYAKSENVLLSNELQQVKSNHTRDIQNLELEIENLQIRQQNIIIERDTIYIQKERLEEIIHTHPNELVLVSDKKQNKNPKFGFINNKGDVVIPHLYEKAIPFNDIGFARVQKESINYLIDTTGKEYLVAYREEGLTSDKIALDLEGLFLKRFPCQALKNEQLQVLILDGSFARSNALKCLPKGIEKLENLEVLSLRYGQLKTLPSSIANLKSLKYLNLQENAFSEVEQQRIRALLPNCMVVF